MTMPAEDDDWSELTDFHPDRVDLVKTAANGTRFLIAKSADGTVMDPEVVRSLAGKPGAATASREASMPQTTTLPNGINISGSPAAIAAFIHQSTVVQKEREASGPDGVEKGEHDTADRKRMAGTGAAMEGGRYPIADEADLKKAIRAVGRGSGSHNAIRKHIISRAKSLGKSSLIPDNWNSDGSVKDSVSKEQEAGVPDTAVAKDAGDALEEMIDSGQDGLDPTVPAAAPDDMDGLPGDPADPGSSVWEAVDSATAAKWSTIIANAKRAVEWLIDREELEAVTVDPDDAANACDLSQACDALDYAIGVLAPFAVSEQSESDRLAFEADVAKGAAEPSSVLGAVVAIAKAGRVLSSANESRIRQASQHLNDVLASLPQAPTDGGPAAVTKEEGAVPGTQDKADDVAKTIAPDAPAEDVAKAEDAMSKEDAAPEGREDVAKASDETTAPAPEEPVTKASPVAILYDGNGELLGVAPSEAVSMRAVRKADSGDDGKPTMQAVFDAGGNLIGIVDPSAITPVSGAGGKKNAPADAEAKPDADASGAPDGSDLEPQPSAAAGTPADGTDDDEDVAKGTQAPGNGENTETTDVFKGIESAVRKALETQEAAHQEAIAKMRGEQAEEIEALKARLETVEAQPASPKVFTNGQTPPSGERPVPAQLRGQDQGAPLGSIDVAKAAERRRLLYQSPDAAEQNRVAKEMQADAYEAIMAAHRR